MVRVEETGIVMIVDKDAKCINVFEMALLFCISILDVVHRLTTKNVLDCEIHWIVEKCSQVILVRSNIRWITIEVFTHLEHARRLSILCPETHWNFRNSINSNAIEFVSLNQILDPILQVISDIVIFLSEVR